MENYVEHKDSYKIYDIAGALSEYFKEGSVLLSEMLSLIDIKSDVPYKVEIKIAQESATNLFSEHIKYKDKPYNGKILLFISKSSFSPARIIRNYKTRYLEEESPIYSIDNADFIIEKKDENFIFKRRYDHNIPKIYIPKLNILDVDRFSELYQQLEDKGYLTYPAIIYFYRGVPAFKLGLSTQSIDLEEIQSFNRELWINYNPANDNLIIKDNRKKPLLTPEEMFTIPIPKEEIYKDYISIIDEYIANKSSKDSPKKLIKSEINNNH